MHGHIQHVVAAARAVADKGRRWLPRHYRRPRRAAEIGHGLHHRLRATCRAARAIGTVTGRYYAMDRDNRWERVEPRLCAMVRGEGLPAPDAAPAVAEAYARGRTDEFIQPHGHRRLRARGTATAFFCLNFRADRARAEILAAIGSPISTPSTPARRPEWAALLGMVDHSAKHDEYMDRRLSQAAGGEHAGRTGRRKRACASSGWPRPKIPHVTFFLERRQRGA